MAPEQATGHAQLKIRAEIQWRIAKIEADLINCVRPSEIIRKYTDEFNVSKNTIESYMRIVRERWAIESSRADRAARRDHLRMLMGDVVNRASKKDDFTSMMRGAESLARLDGLNEKESVLIEMGQSKIQETVDSQHEQFLTKLERVLPAEVFDAVLDAFQKAKNDPDGDGASGTAKEGISHLAEGEREED